MPKTSDNKDLDSLKNALKVPEKIKNSGVGTITNFQNLVSKFNNDPTIKKFIKKHVSKTGSALKETQKALEKFNKVQSKYDVKLEKLNSSYDTLCKDLNKVSKETKKGNSTINSLHDDFQKYINHIIEIAEQRCCDFLNSEGLFDELVNAFEQVRQKVFYITKNDLNREPNLNRHVALYIIEMFNDDQYITNFLKNNSSSELGKALLNLEKYVNTSIDFKELIAYLKEVGESSLKYTKRKGLRKVTATLKNSPLNTKINNLILEINKKKNH